MVVAMVHGEPYTLTYEHFACNLNAWKWLVALGRSAGWNGAGAFASPPGGFSMEGYSSRVDPDYGVNEWRYALGVSAQDAMAWAKALSSANVDRVPPPAPSPLFLSDDLDFETVSQANARPTEVLEGFIQFARLGAFRYAIDE